VITILVQRDGLTELASSLDRRWLACSSDVSVWVDLAAPSVPESLMLTETFSFHPLSVDDATGPRQYPKLEAYDGYLYAILHGIDPSTDGRIATSQLDFFVGRRILVTVHDGRARPIVDLVQHAPRDPRVLAEGAMALFHRIADATSKPYLSAVEAADQRVSEIELQLFEGASRSLLRTLLDCKRQVGALWRVARAEREVMSRMAAREFLDVSTEMALRFRKIADTLGRVVDDATLVRERLADLLTLAAGIGFEPSGRRWF
jgi:magnesium transporter